jgi:hypothetical protein
MLCRCLTITTWQKTYADDTENTLQEDCTPSNGACMGIISPRPEPTDDIQQGSTIISRANPRGRRIRKRVYETFSSLRVDHLHPTTVHSHFTTHVVRGFDHKYL